MRVADRHGRPHRCDKVARHRSARARSRGVALKPGGCLSVCSGPIDRDAGHPMRMVPVVNRTLPGSRLGFESRKPAGLCGPVLASFFQLARPWARSVNPDDSTPGILGPTTAPRHLFGSVPRPSQRLPSSPVHRLAGSAAFGVEVSSPHLGQPQLKALRRAPKCERTKPARCGRRATRISPP